LIINELLKLKEDGAISTVRIASRSDDLKQSHPEWFSLGAELSIVDYEDESTFLPAIEGTEVVVTALNFKILDKQKDLIKVAKTAGAKLFVATDYGVPTDHIKTGFWATKANLNIWFKEFGFPYTRVLCGGWPECIVIPNMGWDFANAKVTVNGVGDSRISWTTRADTARFLTHALTHLTTSELSGKSLRIEGDNLTYNELVVAYEEKTGKKLEVTRIPREVLAEKAAAGDLFAMFYREMDVNGGEVGKPLDNDLFPSWNPKKVLDIIN